MPANPRPGRLDESEQAAAHGVADDH